MVPRAGALLIGIWEAQVAAPKHTLARIVRLKAPHWGAMGSPAQGRYDRATILRLVVSGHVNSVRRKGCASVLKTTLSKSKVFGGAKSR